MTSQAVDVAVIGAGVIGLSVAWRAARDGLKVAICDPEPARGASWAAAGMLAPTTEGRWGEGTLQALSQASAAAWPGYAAALEEDSGLPVGLRRDGTLSVALDADDYRALEESFAVQRELGCDVELLTAQDCRRLEPSLNPRIAGGVLSAGDHQVDNRALLRALTQAVAAAGWTWCAPRCEKSGGRPGSAWPVSSSMTGQSCRQAGSWWLRDGAPVNSVAWPAATSRRSVR